MWDELRVFYHAPALAAPTPAAPDPARNPPPEAAPENPPENPGIERLEVLNARLARWARSSPDLFHRQHLIVSAEIARLRAQDTEAVALYEQAIGAAVTAACPRERALASERDARFRDGRGGRRAAALLMAAARDAYAEWGAVAKVRDLEHRHAELLADPTR